MSEELNQEEVKTVEQSQAEKEARLMGWVPKEEFRDGDHWVDAETFVKRGKEINPILRKNNETLLKKLEESQREIVEVKKVAKEFEKFQKEQAERKVKELESQLKDLREQKKVAISQADGEQVVAIDEAIDAVKAEQQDAKKQPVKEEPKKQEVDPALDAWVADNSWFGVDSKYTRITDAIAAELYQTTSLKGKAFFEKLDEELQTVLPDHLRKKQRPSPVEGNTSGASRPSGNKKQSYENLPADAKAACDKFVKNIPGYTREKYLADYDWS